MFRTYDERKRIAESAPHGATASNVPRKRSTFEAKKELQTLRELRKLHVMIEGQLQHFPAEKIIGWIESAGKIL